jgi:hypothetical protein
MEEDDVDYVVENLGELLGFSAGAARRHAP